MEELMVKGRVLMSTA